MRNQDAALSEQHLPAPLRNRLIGVVCLASLLACFAPTDQGHADTSSGLAYFRGGQFAEAFQSWTAAADAGDAQAALYVGVLYDTGLGVARDDDRARSWYRRAADDGNAVAMFNLGVMYDSGRGGQPDPAAAAYWYGRAAAKRFGRAEYDLALMYEDGSGLPRDRARAVALYRAAARDGISAARGHLLRLGVHYGAAVGNEDTAMRAFDQAERILLARGPTEAADAATLFRRAAEAGNALAAYDLGYCYEHGIGVAADTSEAISWYRRAAQGHSNAIRGIAEASMRALEKR